MNKNGVQHSIELNFLNETILLLGAHERTQANKWLEHIQKGKKFMDWYKKLKDTVQEQQAGVKDPANMLADTIVKKLQELLEHYEGES